MTEQTSPSARERVLRDLCGVCGRLGFFSGPLLLGAWAAEIAGSMRISPSQHGPALLDRAGLAAIRGYQRWLSPRLPIQCRYDPACSVYGLEAVRHYGLAVGGRMAAERVRQCRSTVVLATPDPVA